MNAGAGSIPTKPKTAKPWGRVITLGVFAAVAGVVGMVRKAQETPSSDAKDNAKKKQGATSVTKEAQASIDAQRAALAKEKAELEAAKNVAAREKAEREAEEAMAQLASERLGREEAEREAKELRAKNASLPKKRQSAEVIETTGVGVGASSKNDG